MPTGRMFSVVFEEVAVTAVQDMFEIVAPSDSVVVLHSVVVTQSSDAKDVEDEMLSMLIHLGTTSATLGTVPSPRSLQLGSTAFGGTVRVNATGQASEGNNLHAEAFNIRSGWFYRPTPEQQIVISPSDQLTIELQTAPIDSLTMSGTAIIEEIGG